MSRWFVFLAAALLVACGESEPEVASTPSPLIGADSDRLWILARSSKVGDGRECKALYLDPEEPRYQGLKPKCDHWSRNYADYLGLNGFDTVEYRHLQDPAYWRWYLGMRESISACRSAIGSLSVTATSAERAAYDQARHTCDPFDDAIKNDGIMPDELGIRHN